MKLKILVFVLLSAVMFLSSCQKDSLPPYAASSLNDKNSTAATTNPGIVKQGTSTTNTAEYINLQFAEDAVNTDGTMIVFKPTAHTAYLNTEDAIYLQGFGKVSLSSLSSDNVPLAINVLPLPKTSLTIGLNINATTDGIYNLNMIKINSIPKIFDIWLMDSFKNDSLDFRANPKYAFNVYMSYGTSYGSSRFSLVVRQNPALGIHLLNFTATNAKGGAQIGWLVENEADYTNFTVQRSTDSGQTFVNLSSLVSANLSTYSFLDKTPAKGTDQYRLQIQDLNGTITYSKVIALSY